MNMQNSQPWFLLLAKEDGFDDGSALMPANGYELFEIYYKNVFPDETRVTCENGRTLVQSRMAAVQKMFQAWTKLGHNKRHAANPFGCKAFMAFLKKEGYFSADYLLIKA